MGWVARTGPIPLGYLGDQKKTEATFPTVEGIRWSVPGDRARLRGDGMIQLLGHDSITINSAGEKIFAEEVEQAILIAPDVVDVVVVGRPSERWGQEVVAVVALVAGSEVTDAELALLPRPESQGTSFPRSSCASRKCCAARQARPTLAGPATSPHPPPVPNEANT